MRYILQMQVVQIESFLNLVLLYRGNKELKLQSISSQKAQFENNAQVSHFNYFCAVRIVEP